MANLRVVYDNAADRATPSASTTAGSLSASNLLTDIKSEVYRSTGTSTTITLTWSVAEKVRATVIPFSNLTASSTMRVRGYTNAGDANPVFDTGSQNAVKAPSFAVWGWGSVGMGANTFAYGGASCAVLWHSGAYTVQKVVIDLVDSSNTQGYIECSRVICGDYWEADYNPDYGVTAGTGDLSTHQRTDAGDLRTDRGAIYKTLSLDLNYMTANDRNIMWRIARGNGMAKPMYVSVVPGATDPYEEQVFQIYGKMTKGASIKYTFANQYGTSLDLEEV